MITKTSIRRTRSLTLIRLIGCSRSRRSTVLIRLGRSKDSKTARMLEHHLNLSSRRVSGINSSL